MDFLVTLKQAFISLAASAPLDYLYKFINLHNMLLCSLVLFSIAKLYFWKQRRNIFLVDFACYKPVDALKCSHKIFLDRSALLNIFSDESLAFQKTILDKSGLGQSTYFPEAMWGLPPNPCMALARKEVETVFFGAIDELFKKTKVKPCDIKILVTNSSLFNPTPSLTSVIVNQYKMRSNILSFNLGGMGCSAGLISADLAKHLLQVHPNSLALVLSTENITLNWYFGNNRSMLVSNCLFRMGASAVLLSNRASDRHRAKYKLLNIVRTHKGNDDRGYKCAFQQEDNSGNIGVNLSKDLASVAGEALRTNLTTLGPKFLPISERLRFFANAAGRKYLKMKMKAYMPDFKLAFDHFCVHAGGRAVLDTVEQSLKLTADLLEPSRMTLYRFGNTSSSTLWYELAYSEAKGRVRKKDRVCQIAFGSGFKCNSAVWEALKTVDPSMEKNPWMEEIEGFPVQLRGL